MAQRTVDQVKGRLAQQQDGQIVLTLPGTDYQLHLAVASPVSASAGQRIAGRIIANARRVDVAADGRGGSFIEPVFGRPRRLQGRILAVDAKTNTLTVRAVCPFVCTLMPLQKASDFKVGDFVMFDIERGAQFVPDATESA